jgi:large repetitive protein
VEIFDGRNDLGAASLQNGQWMFAATSLTAGNHSFTANVTDAAGNQMTTGAVTLTVVVDPGPTAGNAHLYNSPELSVDLTIPLLTLDTPGLPGDALTLTGVSTAGTRGTLSPTNGDLRYIAPASGTDAFAYTVSDQLNDSATATVNVSLRCPETAQAASGI